MQRGLLNASPRHFLLLGLLSCTLGTPSALAASDAAAEVVRHLDRCLRALDGTAEPLPPYRRLILEEVCPGLARAVAELPAAGSLSQPLDQQTTPNQLQDLRALLVTYRSPPASVERFDFAALPELLARTLAVEPTPPVSWWQRFKDWLTKKLRGSGKSDYRWLTEFLKSLDPPEWLADLILRASIAVILLLALAVVVNELRAANLSSWLQRQKPHATPQPRTGGQRRSQIDVEGCRKSSTRPATGRAAVPGAAGTDRTRSPA